MRRNQIKCAISGEIAVLVIPRGVERQITGHLGVNESRISQLHKRALSILRERLLGRGLAR